MSQGNERKRLPPSYYDDGSRKRQSRPVDSDPEDIYPPVQAGAGRGHNHRDYDDDDNRNRFFPNQRDNQNDRRRVMGGNDNDDDYEFQNRNRGRYNNDRVQDRHYRGGGVGDDDEDDAMYTGRRPHQSQRDSDGRYGGGMNEDRGNNVHRGRPQYFSDNDEDYGRPNNRNRDGGFRNSNQNLGSSKSGRYMNNDDDDDSYNNNRSYGNQRRQEQYGGRSQPGNDNFGSNNFGKSDNGGPRRGEAEYRERQRINLERNNSMGTKKMIGGYDDYYNPNVKQNANRNFDRGNNFSRGNRNVANYDSDSDNRYRGSNNNNSVAHRNPPTIDEYYDSDPDVDPFPNALRCNPINKDVSMNYQTIEWYSPDAPIPIEMEEAVIPTLVQYGARERGTFVFQTVKRLQNVKNILHKVSNTRMSRDRGEQSLQNPPKMDLLQALSLRRHHMKLLNPNLSMTQLHLGLEQNIQRAAQLFEKAMEDYLVQNYISYYNEHQQKQHILQNKKENEPYPPTPDFVFKDPIRVCKYTFGTDNVPEADAKDGQENPEPREQPTESKIFLNEKLVCWMEMKMFYGANTIPPDNKSAVGCILSTARKYVRVYGPGAMVFLYGYGEQLGQQLEEIGVMPLDCNHYYHHDYYKSKEKLEIAGIDPYEGAINLDPVIAHQRSWCANRDGDILP